MNTQIAQRLRSGFVLLALIGLGLVVGLAAATEPALTLLAVAGLFMMAAMVVRPELITPVVVFLLYTNLPVLGRTYHGLPGVITLMVPAALGLPLYYHMVIRRERLILPPSFPWVGLFFVSVLLSTLFSRNMAQAMPGLINYLTEGLLLYVLFTNVVRTTTHVRWAAWALALAGIVTGGLPLFQQLTGTFDNNYGGLAQISEASFRTGATDIQGDIRQPRLSGMIGEINRYAQVMLMLVPVGVMLFFGEKNKWLRLLGAVSGFLSAVGMVLAFSRGAAVAFVLMLGLMVFFRVIRGKQMLLMLVVAALVLAMIPQYFQRLMSVVSLASVVTGENTGGEDAPDGAVRGRLTEMWAAARVYGDYPVFGVGPSMFKYYSRQYSLDIALRNLMGNREAHSLYLGMAAELGTVGLGLFGISVFVTLRELYTARRRSHRLALHLEYLPTMFILILMAYLTTAIFLHFSYMRYFWMVFAIASAAASAIHKELDVLEFPALAASQQRDGGTNA